MGDVPDHRFPGSTSVALIMAKGPSKWTCWCLFIEARYNRARSVIGAIQAVWPSSQVFSWSNERPPEYFTAPSVSPPLISFNVG